MTGTSFSAPALRASAARLAPISSVSRSVMRVTRSPGRILRHVRMAFLAPGTRSSAYTDGSSIRFCMFLEGRSVRGREARLSCQLKALARLLADVIDDFHQVPRLLVDTKLPVRPGAFLEDPVYPLDFLARAKLVHDVVDELQHFLCQGA